MQANKLLRQKKQSCKKLGHQGGYSYFCSSMASVNSPIRSFLKPLLFKLMGKRGYFLMQYYAKKKDIEGKLVEEPEMVLFPNILKEDSVSLDIGANFAYHTVRYAQLSPKGKVYAFEPIPFTFKVCQKIVKHYHLPQVEVFQKGVGNENKTVTFSVPLQDFGAMSAGQAHLGARNNELEGKEKHYKFSKSQEIEAEIIRIDDFLLPKLTRLDYVKMDIEGAEYFALQGMEKTLKQFKPLVFMEINPFFLQGFGISERSLNECITQLGYEVYVMNPQTQKVALYPKETAYVENNYILIHPENKTPYQAILA